MTKLIFCATPSRLENKKESIMDFVTKQGFGPLHPFQALPLKRFEHGPIGRKKCMEFCLRLIDAADEFWVFGISKGTMQEIKYAAEKRKIIRLFLEWDPDWKKFYEELKKEYGEVLKIFK
ncbi:MAG: hypothetical protein J4473_03905 [Candidatus Aenigmarchaeota archaeon]|nr:hypothetical protein [Candidatus Aenigmarchaeota archaeon]